MRVRLTNQLLVKVSSAAGLFYRQTVKIFIHKGFNSSANWARLPL